MRIGIVTSTYWPNLNGISLSLESLVKDLKERDNYVKVATPEVKDIKYPDYILPLPTFPLTKLFSSVLQDISLPFRFYKVLYNSFKEANIEVIHSHDSGLLFNAADKVAKQLNIPHVHTYHVLMEEYLKVLHPFGYKYLARKISKSVCNKADHIIVPTVKIENYLKSIGVTKPITTVLNVPNLEHLPKIEFNKAIARDLGIDKKDFVFLSFGRLVQQKRIDLTIEYLEPILKNYWRSKLVIAGFGPELKSLQKLVKEKKLDKKVIFTGRYDKEMLDKLGSVSKCFVITSRSETQGLTVMEAMKMGLPVIAVDDNAYDYILENKSNGFKINDSNFTKSGLLISINNLLSKIVYKHFSRRAVESANELLKQDFTKMHLAIYNASSKTAAES